MRDASPEPEHAEQSAIFALLPFRGLHDPKSRLGNLLSLDERRDLALHLLNHAIDAVLTAGVARVAIVTHDAALATRGLDARVTILLQHSGGLNAAIREGQDWATQQGATALLILLPDLPLLAADDVRTLMRDAAPGVAVIAPDRHGTGTNALLLTPPDAIAPAFGAASADRHRRGLALADIAALDVERPGFQLDLDTPEDLEMLAGVGATHGFAGSVARPLR